MNFLSTANLTLTSTLLASSVGSSAIARATEGFARFDGVTAWDPNVSRFCLASNDDDFLDWANPNLATPAFLELMAKAGIKNVKELLVFYSLPDGGYVDTTHLEFLADIIEDIKDEGHVEFDIFEYLKDLKTDLLRLESAQSVNSSDRLLDKLIIVSQNAINLLQAEIDKSYANQALSGEEESES